MEHGKSIPSQAMWKRPHGFSSSDYAHDQQHEWAAENSVSALDDSWSLAENPKQQRNSGSPKTSLRLLVLKSGTLPKSRIAVIDGYTEVQLGRDKPSSENIPRIRIKEMGVSKLHASIYWDKAWDSWGVVDMGSKHGTFLRSTKLSSTGSSPLVERDLRLSTSRTASTPKRLYHLDQLTLGTTTFLVHIHENCLPCEECSPGVAEDIPLFATSSTSKHHSTVGDSFGSSGNDVIRPYVRNSKVALSRLKNNLLSRHSNHNSTLAESVSQYVDRSARRRAIHPASSSDAPGVASPFHSLRQSSPSSNAEPVSLPVAPIPTSSIGHKLLIKQGWHPGTSLGLADGGLVEPLDPKYNFDRSGLGLTHPAASHGVS